MKVILANKHVLFEFNQDVEDKKLRGLIIWQCKKCKASLEEKLQTPVKGPLGYITHDHRSCTNKDNLAGKKKLSRQLSKQFRLTPPPLKRNDRDIDAVIILIVRILSIDGIPC